jgi:hypothetical protein
MGSVYSQAVAVLAWMGPGDEGGRWMERINSFAPVLKSYADPSCWDWPESMAEECLRLALDGFKWPQAQGFDLRKDELFEFCKVFFLKSKIWRRSWIVPEMVLARSSRALWFVWGKRRTNFAALVAFTGFLGAFQAMPAEFLKEHGIQETAEVRLIQLLPWGPCFMGFHHVKEMREIRKSQQSDIEIVPQANTNSFVSQDHFKAILYNSMGRSASDPRDMVYALLGIAINSIVPDYTKSVREVYLDHFRSDIPARMDICLRSSGNGRHHAQANEHQLPSWMPDFSNFSSIDAAPDPAGPSAPSCFRTSKQDNVAKVSLPEGILHIEGTICHEVQLVTPLDFDGNSIADVTDPRDAEVSKLRRLCIDCMIQAKVIPHPNEKRPLPYSIPRFVRP